MESKFISRMIILSLLTSFLISVVFSFFFSKTMSIFIGTLLGCLNLTLLSKVLSIYLIEKHENKLKLIGMVGLKFPVLYYIGYLVLKSRYVDPLYLLMGFSLIFGVMFVLGLVYNLQSYSNREIE